MAFKRSRKKTPWFMLLLALAAGFFVANSKFGKDLLAKIGKPNPTDPV